jgi:RNA polymerase sigma factor (sigma-70 family)
MGALCAVSVVADQEIRDPAGLRDPEVEAIEHSILEEDRWLPGDPLEEAWAENAVRRLNDQVLVAELAASGFRGPLYEATISELATYALAVLMAWMRTGYIFKLTTARGLVLHPTDAELESLHRDENDVREELASMTVAAALPRFQLGGWRAEGGASLTTYFMGACLYVFPNEFRKWRRRAYELPVAEIPDAQVDDPTEEVVEADFATRLINSLPRRQREVMWLYIVEDLTPDEIARWLQLSPGTVRAVLHRARQNLRDALKQDVWGFSKLV